MKSRLRSSGQFYHSGSVCRSILITVSAQAIWLFAGRYEMFLISVFEQEFQRHSRRSSKLAQLPSYGGLGMRGI